MKTTEAINKVLETFEAGNLPKAMAYSLNPTADVPSNKWSFNNRILMILSGTTDARGYKQWQGVGRFPKKGSKAIYILAPNTKRVNSDDEEKFIITGFRCQPVFRYEDTDGEELEYLNIELPKLPLLEVAEYIGVNVSAIPNHGDFYGYYSIREQKICLATNSEVVFYHELAHALDTRLRGLQPKKGQQVDREIVAELSACTLAYMLSKEMPESTGNHFKYIKNYAEKVGMNVLSACHLYFSEVEAVVNEVFRISNIINEEVSHVNS